MRSALERGSQYTYIRDSANWTRSRKENCLSRALQPRFILSYHVVQNSTMSPALPFDVIAIIIDIVGENKDTNLLKELALVSQSFLQICSNHLFATVELYNDNGTHRTKGFVKLLKSRPDVVKHIRKLTYMYINDDDHLLSPIPLNFLPTISRLNCLTLNLKLMDWNELDSSLTLAFLHLMHLPTINHISLSYINNFPLSSLTPSVNLHRLDISNLWCLDSFDEDGSRETIVQLEMMPKIREFHASGSAVLTKLLHAERQDGRPAFNFMDLRRFSTHFEDERNVRYLLQNAKLLESLDLSVGRGRSLVGLHDILSLSARTLKVLHLTVALYDNSLAPPLGGLCEELEAMAGHNMLEALSLEVEIDCIGTDCPTEDSIGSIIEKVEKVLVKPGWSALRQVSFKLPLARWGMNDGYRANLCEALQSLPDKYLSHLSKLESVAFDYSAYVV
jgi:hypothetical protein